MIEKVAVPITSIIVIILIFAIGLVAFNAVVDSVSGPQASQNMNCTMSTGSTVYNVLGIVIIIAAVSIIVGLLLYWVSTPERYNKPNKVLQFLSKTTLYFGYGALSLVIVAIPGYMIWFLYNFTVVEGNTGPFLEIFKWILVLVVAYFAIAGLGYISKKYFYDKLSERLKEKEYEENINDLPKVTTE